MVLLLVASLILSMKCYSIQVVYLGARATSRARGQMETVTRFYGVEHKVILVRDAADTARAIEELRRHKTVAAVIDADVLPYLSRRQALEALRRMNSPSAPLLIVGIAQDTNAGLLRQWSGGAITGCGQPIDVGGKTFLSVAVARDVTRQLSGKRLPLGGGRIAGLTLDPSRDAQPIISVNSGSREWPIFVRMTLDEQEIFFTTAAETEIPETSSDPYREPAVFSALAPEMMFVRYAAGERAWHSVGQFANLTIDDPWLREPYGHVDYAGLLREMERHKFHTTIAFIPWNFDRSQTSVVSLIRAHADEFSICVHGNNHDHQEFGPEADRSLDEQIANIKQGLARMEKFRSINQLPYDRVMVFPHSIGSEQALAVLKRYNFLATANSRNVPSGSNLQPEPEFAMRTTSLAFANFPSMRRYSAEAPIPEAQLVVDAFLGNPILFYVHQEFFSGGVSAFDTTADLVNEIQPDIQWQSLGSIAKQLYLQRLRDDGNYDIKAYSGHLLLKNTHERDTVFFVEKEEDFAYPLTVLVDGQPYPYERSARCIRIQLTVRAGASCEVAIEFLNDLRIAAIDISKPSLRLNMLRQLSDFRDMWVSRTALGRRLIRVYANNESGWNRAIAVVSLLFTALIGLLYARKIRKGVETTLAQDASSPPSPASRLRT